MKTLTQIFVLICCGLTVSAQNSFSKRVQKLVPGKVLAMFQSQGGLNKTTRLCVEDSMIINQWQNNAWKKTSKYIYGYGSHLKRNSQTTYNFYNNSWQASLRTTKTFNSVDSLTYNLNQNWNSILNNWNNSSSDAYTYDNNNNLLLQSHQVWNSGSSSWGNSSRTTYTYQNNNMIAEFSEFWDTQNNIWKGSSRTTYTYSGNLVTIEVNESGINGSLTNNSKVIYSYNIFNIPTDLVFQLWDTTSNTWVNAEKLIFNASGTQLISALDQVWDISSNSWINDGRYSFTYDGSGNQTMELDEQWNTNSNIWENAFRYLKTYDSQSNLLTDYEEDWINNAWQGGAYKYIYTYDIDNNQITRTQQNWRNSLWENSSLNERYYNCTTVGITENRNIKNSFIIYPNPAQSYINIVNPIEYTNLTILNISGQVVLETNSKSVILVSGLDKGIYFINLLDKNSNVIGREKFIKD